MPGRRDGGLDGELVCGGRPTFSEGSGPGGNVDVRTAPLTKPRRSHLPQLVTDLDNIRVCRNLRVGGAIREYTHAA
jgi:hypothetical protein